MNPLSQYERSLLFLVLPPHRNCWVFLLIGMLASSNSRGAKKAICLHCGHRCRGVSSTTGSNNR